MTTALERARTREAQRDKDREYDRMRRDAGYKLGPFIAKPWVECPVCGTPTAVVTRPGTRSYVVTLIEGVASGYEDGARCVAHRRSLAQRWEQTVRAMATVEPIAWMVSE